jgi:hypothetical protein
MFRTLSTRRQRPVAHLLTGLVLACLLPGILGSALFLLSEYREKRDQQSEEMLHLAHDIGRAVDAHLLRAETLARSLRPRTGTPAARPSCFRRRART